MRSAVRTLALTATALLGLSLLPVESATSVLPAGSHCVAYKSRKTQAMVAQSDIVGSNCGVTVKAVKAANGELAAEIIIPIYGFNSKEKDRDKEVAKLLSSGSHPNLTVRTETMTAAEWKALLQKGGGAVKAQLVIGGKSFTITANPKITRSGNKVEVSGVITSKFTAFGIKPPEVGPGGVIAKAPDYLELHYNFVSGKVQNLAVVPM
ncbi:MAG: hypothetical protein CVV27_04500 [Candidatus Melainabacteria bacterium HGW-Melainabacteria-1]|nr:MAG: hypothetical protein CVV27_04500 [Candidatus Melainabacteria bacterium HGW-Melainabacteria-1]